MSGLISKFELLRQAAKTRLPKKAFDYVDCGADDEVTLRRNREAWRRIELVPRVLTGRVKDPDISCTFLGYEIAAPLLIAPMAMHSLMHSEGECATAAAAEACGIPMCVSMYGSKDLEDIQKANSKNPIFFQQFYMNSHEGYMKNFLNEVYGRGCRVLLYTADSPVTGNQERNITNNYAWKEAAFAMKKEKYWKGILRTDTEVLEISDRCEWSVISWIKSVVNVRILVKGVLSPADAALAVEHGADGIIVSNHGGRQLDTAVTAPDVLPAIARVVNKRVPILVDGGIQRGTDIIKALAMGATAVLIGRPILYALAVGGTEKVAEVIDGIKKELSNGLLLCGFSSIDDITADVLHRPD